MNRVIMQSMAELTTILHAPLKAWEDGTIRVGSSRVLLDLVVHHFKQGATAEQIQHSFPSLTLHDVYGVLFYYLEHTEQVEAYLADQERQAAEVEREVRNIQGATFLQRRLEERRARTLKWTPPCMLKLLIDENLDQRILRGLQLRLPSLAYTIAQEASLAGAPDALLLQWAADNQHVLVTHDRKTMLKAAHRRITSGQKTAGLVIVRKELPLKRAIEDLLVVLECCTETDIENQVVFIPI
jgi:uncharacterized protein (DUF433 family)/predicted nuclease of predicted toxin-antitoxin system